MGKSRKKRASTQKYERMSVYQQLLAGLEDAIAHARGDLVLRESKPLANVQHPTSQREKNRITSSPSTPPE